MCQQAFDSTKPSATDTPRQLQQTSGVIGTVSHILSHVVTYWRTLVFFMLGGSYDSCPCYAEDTPAKVQVYSLYLISYMWSKPHYRSGTFSGDMRKNLRNVAIPGTGLPLSTLCYFKVLVYPFLFFVYPMICFGAAAIAALKRGEPLAGYFSQQLLNPQDWFSFWRLNCRLASFHSYIENSKGYSMEDKWTFLVKGKEAGVAVSPYFDGSTCMDLVIKDKNEEGGMGIYFFKNASVGGDWIIQERLTNDKFVGALLPDNPPLSTIRVISSSLASLNESSRSAEQDIKCLSCVFRAGRQGASTDHSAILFDVDTDTGVIKRGTTNAYWYKLGAQKLGDTSWTTPEAFSQHPDCGVDVTGHVFPNIEEILQICREAHFKLLPDVPFAGWDVALTNKGMCLLEVNLSCNFFKGHFDQQWYFSYVDAQFKKLDKKRLEQTASSASGLASSKVE